MVPHQFAIVAELPLTPTGKLDLGRLQQAPVARAEAAAVTPENDAERAVRAALVQLLVPVLTAAAGILLLAERPAWRLLLAGPLILGGVGIAVLGRRQR